MKNYKIAAAIVRQGDQIAMVRQKIPNSREEGVWTLPSGKVEPGETYVEAAIREVREETGLEPISDPEFIYECEYENTKDGIHCTVEMYEFKSCEGDLEPNDPDDAIEEASFFNLQDTVNMLSELNWPMVKEPAVAYLEDSSNKNLCWIYKADQDGEYQRISVIQSDHSKKKSSDELLER